MKSLIKIINLIIIISLFIQALFFSTAYAAELVPPTPPQNINIADIGYESSSGQNWFVKFLWLLGSIPISQSEIEDQGQKMYFNEIERGTGNLKPDVIKISMGAGATELNTAEYGIELKNGVIYEFYGRTWYTHIDGGTVESGKSTKVKFLTGLNFGAELVSGTNHIKIRWDDVWDEDGRIDYRILISDTSGFTQPPPIPDIMGSEIGESDRVTVSGDKLEYIYTGALPGREYSIKIVPLVNDDVAVVPTEELPAVKVKTEILLRTKKIGNTISGSIWEFFWDPIVKGSIGTSEFEQVLYKLYRYDENNEESFFAQIPDKDYFFIHVKSGEESKYTYKIEAEGIRNDGSRIQFYSNKKVSLNEQIPEYPEAPEIVDAFSDADPEPLTFESMITQDSATVLWKVPLKDDGTIDTDISYDMYLVDNLDDITLLPANKKIASSMSMTADNEVRQKGTNSLIGYKYRIENLKPNSTYYYIIIAKKNYLIENPENGFMAVTPYASEPSVKVIITPPDTKIDKPLAPPSPPFKIKDGEQQIRSDSASLETKKRWHEFYDKEQKKWEYFTKDEYEANALLDDSDPNKKEARIVDYTAGWKIHIHCVRYAEAVRAVESFYGRDYLIHKDLSRAYITGLSLNFPEVTVPDFEEGEPQIIDLNLENLTPNTTYVAWITVENSEGIESDPSSSILFTTLPDIPNFTVIPTVPVDLRGIAADTYVDLFWSFKKDFSYEIRYALEDNVEKALLAGMPSYDDLKYQPYFRVANLEADTLYYFWIRAVSTSPEGETVYSDWSDPILITTEAYYPPDIPGGFGIKSGEKGITSTSITYEWIKKDNLTYIMEFAKNADFTNSVEYNVGQADEYKIANLDANKPYYARLYAYDSETKLRSEPTRTVMVVTSKSGSEYDADKDLEKVLSRDIIVKDNIENGVWHVSIVDDNAQRAIEEITTDSRASYIIDLTEPLEIPKSVLLDLDSGIINALKEMKKNIIVKTGFAKLTLQGGIAPDSIKEKIENAFRCIYRFKIDAPINSIPLGFLAPIAPVISVKTYLGEDDNWTQIGYYKNPLKISIPITNIDDYIRSDIKIYRYSSGEWSPAETVYDYSKKVVKTFLYTPITLTVSKKVILQYRDIEKEQYRKRLENILKKYTFSDINSDNFLPKKEITTLEAVKMVLDIVPFKTSGDRVMEVAFKVGLIHFEDIANPDKICRRDQAIAMAVELYGLKTGQNIEPVSIDSSFKDLSEVRKIYKDEVNFAIKNGMVYGRENNKLFPASAVNRIEMVMLLERVLKMAGEI